LVFGRFINFGKGRKFLTLLTFGCPTHDTSERSAKSKYMNETELQRHQYCYKRISCFNK